MKIQTNPNVKLRTASLFASLIVAANAATSIQITGVTGTSSSPGFNSGGITQTTSFGNTSPNYNPLDPKSVNNQPGFGNTVANYFHGLESNNIDVILNYNLNTAFTTTLTQNTVVVDLYGRTGYVNSDPQAGRDDNVDVILFNLGSQVANVTGIKIDQPALTISHGRATFNLASGVRFDAIRVVGHDTSDPDFNYFSLNETAVAVLTTVPEPSSTAILGLGGLALILRRSK